MKAKIEILVPDTSVKLVQGHIYGIVLPYTTNEEYYILAWDGSFINLAQGTYIPENTRNLIIREVECSITIK